MVMCTNTQCFDFFHVILCILSQYVQNYRPSASPLIYFFKEPTPPPPGYLYISLLIIPNVHQHNTKTSNYEY